jgi:hypothetical protein
MVCLWESRAFGPGADRGGAAVARADRLRRRKRKEATVRRTAERVIGKSPWR